MSTLPAPPIPHDVSLGSNEWFPFYFRRLRKSKWWRRASDMARSRNVMLWGEAYGQTPAGSMPDDDDELAEAAGFGMDVGAFQALKAEIMAPWTLCSDARWYHPTLCEVVMEAWDRLSEKRRKGAERQRRRRTEVRGDPEGVTLPDAMSRVTALGVTRDIEQQDTTDKTNILVKCDDDFLAAMWGGTPAGPDPRPLLTPAESPKPKPHRGLNGHAADFERWYAAYPKKVARGAAEKAFVAAIKIAPIERLIETTKAYAAAKAGSDRQFIKNPATWLNQKCWDDEPAPAAKRVTWV